MNEFFNNSKLILLDKNTIKNEDLLSNYINCEVNDSQKLYNQRHIFEKNIWQTTESIRKKSCVIENELEDSNKNANFGTSILHENIEIKEENIKVESIFDKFSDEDSNGEHKPSEIIEFVDSQKFKVEETDEYDKEKNICDPINRGRNKV